MAGGHNEVDKSLRRARDSCSKAVKEIIKYAIFASRKMYKSEYKKLNVKWAHKKNKRK